MSEHIVVCAALRCIQDGILVLGVRHYDAPMHEHIKRIRSIDPYALVNWEQGFIDNKGNFLTREEAWVVARDAEQIIRRVGGDGTKLFSENLY
jgi:hypothetical protein